YNLNYLLKSDSKSLVFRVNMGTQINRADQILYEYDTLRLLQKSGVTPIPCYVDDSRTLIDRGISIMEYLPGRHLDYEKDLRFSARLFSILHQLPVRESQNHLIRESQPLSLIFTECTKLLSDYFQSELADREIRSFLMEVIDWAQGYKDRECYYIDDPFFCIVNTEVNSTNFIVNPKQKTTHLIDWEMARWGDPSTDLCHFCSPLTTLWKTGYRFSPATSADFLTEYKNSIRSAHLRNSLEERMRLKFPFVLLRGISWSAMAWAAYQTEYSGMRDRRTWKTLQRYMDIDFIRALFVPFMKD
ncbi:MAG: aminoglycoside phosphotransferase family protein, partial [Deltaproteobacteria bacterium]|nr:aminoglycoside phosphotransferase family protein [Deltaproteobacteria bacterium]